MIGLCAAVPGCAGGPGLPTLGSSISTGTGSGSPIEVYTRIARAARACWFGPSGRLSKTHLFHADADPPARGGRVEIAVHERAPQPKPWGLKAFRIGLSESSGQTAVEVENVRLPEADAQQMREEVFAWAQGQESCTRIPDPPAATSALPEKVPVVRTKK
jgi:hypothetical protein